MSVDPAMGFDSGGTVGAVATCRAVTPGSSVPGRLLLPWGRLDRGPRGQGMARTQLTASANSCA